MKVYWATGLALCTVLSCGAAAGTGMQVARNAYGEIRKTAVRTDDLDLSGGIGAKELLARLEYAAVRVCDADSMNWNLRRDALRRACVRTTMRRAVASVSAPLVRQLYVADVRGER